MQKYDLIGDIHGYATKLKALLHKLGYTEKKGTFAHCERKAIFVGDFIDRGPEIRETLQTVRAMVDGGSAHAVMGTAAPTPRQAKSLLPRPVEREGFQVPMLFSFAGDRAMVLPSENRRTGRQS